MAFSFTKAKGLNLPPRTSVQANPHDGAINAGHGPLSAVKSSGFQQGKTARWYPAWLKDNASCLKQLPGIYHGVLGQVQLQPTLVMSDSNKFTNGLEKLVRQHQKVDYLNRFTDTERVHQLLSTSRLSNEHLATIWAHVNKTFPGQLTNREVCLALALIAIFQRLETETFEAGIKKDPFDLIKLEKKPPVPTLYPNEGDRNSLSQLRISASSSMPNDLNSGGLLIEISNGDESQNNTISVVSPRASEKLKDQKRTTARMSSKLNLIDMDNHQLEENFFKLMHVWLKSMNAIKSLFKRSFDLLNVENSRHSALEALRSDKGVQFCKRLCLCYPIAHNIMFKIDELKSFQLKAIDDGALFEVEYLDQINELMISINEYWAVLINLFHESGQTSFIEVTMDGLNRNYRTLASETLEQLFIELDTASKPDTCSICLTKFYLVNIGDALDKRDLPNEDLELVLNNEPMSQDDCYYYHAKCANFWLNNVQNNGDNLPFLSPTNDGILLPTSN